MEKIIISTDSAADLSVQIMQDRGIAVTPFNVILGAQEYLDGVNITPQMIFDYVKETKVLPKTAAIGTEIAAEYFAGLLENAETVIHFTISSGCSVTYNNVMAAAERFGGRVKVIDSLHLSTGQGLLVLKACDLKDAGKAADEIVEEINALREKTQTSFVVDTVEYLYKGGRCSAASRFAAALLHVHPAIVMKEGKLGVKGKYMGSLKRCIGKYIDDLAKEYHDYEDTRVFVTHSSCDEEIVQFAMDMVKEKFNFKEILTTVAGATITSHCGQGTLGVLFITK